MREQEMLAGLKAANVGRSDTEADQGAPLRVLVPASR